MQNHTRVAGTTIGLSLFFVSPSLAIMDTSVFDNRLDWQLATGVPEIETFESESLVSRPLPATLDSGLTFDVIGNVTASIFFNPFQDSNGFVNTTPGGDKVLRFGRNGEMGFYSAVFSTSDVMQAFGFNISGWQPTDAAGGPTGGANITLLNGGQVVDDFFLFVDADIDDVNFIGLANIEGFDEVRFLVAQLPDSFSDDVAFDDVVWVVPAPSSLALLGLGGLAAVRRRRP